MHSRLHYLAGAGIRFGMRRAATRFLRQLERPRDVQHAVLRKLIALNADSEFSRRHALSNIRTPSDFRQRLPVSEYSFFQPWIERMKNGETGALLGSRNRLLMLALTSGTTAGAKFLPITERFFADYRREWKIWSVRAYDAHPLMYRLNIVQLSSDHDQFRTAGGHPCGNISGLVSAMQRRFVQNLYSVPGVVAKIKSPEAKYYTAMRLALADPWVGLVMTANPSTLVHLAKLGDAHREELVRDIADGTLSSRIEVDPLVRQTLRKR